MKPAPITPGRWDTIALLGMAPSTRVLSGQVPADTAAFGIGAAWVLEHAARPFDVCVEIHPRWMLEHPNYSPGLLDWLGKPRSGPLYTAQYEPDWPGSVVYPLDFMLSYFLGGVRKGDEQARYFCSSFDYALALAILYAPKRIAIYGFDMATDTEYRYQREGGAFWMGVAAGRGIEIQLPENTKLLSGALYGYEGTRVVRYGRVERLMQDAARQRKNYRARFQRAAAKLSQANGNGAADEAAHQRAGRLRDLFFLWDGARQAARELLKDVSIGDLLSRETIERQRTALQVGATNHASRLNWWEGVVHDRRVRYNDNQGSEPNRSIFLDELQQAHQLQGRVRDDYFTFSGGVQLLNHLIRESDLEAPEEFEVRLNITELDVVPKDDVEAMPVFDTRPKV